MRRRYTPYSRLAEIRANRVELVALALVTVALGATLSLASDALYEMLRARLPAGALLALGLAASAGLAAAIVWLLYSGGQSRRLQIDLYLPYHLPASGGDEAGGPHRQRLMIAEQPAYQVTRHARRLVARALRPGSPALAQVLAAWIEAQPAGVPFQKFVAPWHADLTQCLVLYNLHRYGRESLGPEARFGWWAVDLPAVPWSIERLPEPLNRNPFLLAEQKPDEWKLLLPEGVSLSLQPQPGNPWPRWTLRHRRYGAVTVTWPPHVSVAGRTSQTYRVLTAQLRPRRRSQLFVLGTRLEARADFRLALWPGADEFHRWATGWLARLEEGLDWRYFLQTRPARILADLDWKVGWLKADESLVDILARLERRLDDLSVE